MQVAAINLFIELNDEKQKDGRQRTRETHSQPSQP
jgi:hypothetical protein